MRLRWYFILPILASLLLLTTVGWGKITSKYVNAPKVNVRSAPSKNASIITTLSLNTKVKCIKESKGWTKVNISPLSKQGWIFSALLSDKPVNASSLGALGGGYKNAKWGMSPTQVKNVLKGEIIDSGERDFISYIEYNIGAGKTLKCWFYKNRFYQVWYTPGLKDDDEEGAKAVLMALTKKYGPGKILKGDVDSLGFPKLTIIWDDGITEIKYRMYHPDPSKYPREWRHLSRKSSSLWVSYANKKIRDNINREEKAEKERHEKERLRQKMKAVEEDL